MVGKITANIKSKFQKAAIFKTPRNSKHAYYLQQRGRRFDLQKGEGVQDKE